MSFTALWAKEDWNNFDTKDITTFDGTIVHTQDSGSGIMQRSNPYKLKSDDGKTTDIYCGETDELKQYIGKKVTLQGKAESFEMEGSMVNEIWPCGIKLAQ
eukprot:gene6021-10023_t